MSDVTTELANEANDKTMEIARLKSENDRLREQIHWLKQGDILHVLTDQEYIDQCERERLMQVSIDALDNENAKLRELAVSYDSALHRMCNQMQGYVDCRDCILGKDYDNEDSCAIDELREAACVVKVELE